jgi:hypothetical protein
MRRTIALDFDGVVHSYTSRWQAAEVIPDPPTEGAAQAIGSLRDAGFWVVIFSTRCATYEGRQAIHAWLNEHRISVDDVVDQKPMSVLLVDDRGFRFEGKWQAVVDFALDEGSLAPWNKLP